MLTDLPSPNTRRWCRSRKYQIVNAIKIGTLTEERAISIYGFSSDELRFMMSVFDKFGPFGLRATQVQYYKNMLRKSA